VCVKKLIKNSHPFGKKCQKTAGGIFLTHTVVRNHGRFVRCK